MFTFFIWGVAKLRHRDFYKPYQKYSMYSLTPAKPINFIKFIKVTAFVIQFMFNLPTTSHAQNTLTLDNGRMLAEFGPIVNSTGNDWGCTRIFDQHRNQELMNEAVQGLWKIEFTKPTGSESIIISTASPGIQSPMIQLESNGSATFIWNNCLLPDSSTFDVHVSVREEDTGLHWSISVFNSSSTFGINSLLFPMLNVLDARSTPEEEDWIVYPDGWGTQTRNPQLSFHKRYPSQGCVMQFMLYGTNAGGLYFAAEDGRAFTKELWADATGAGTTRLSFRHFPEDMLQPGVDYTQPFDIVTKPYTGTWYDGARIYRKWALQQKWASAGPVSEREDIPERFKRLTTCVKTLPPPLEGPEEAQAAREFFNAPILNHLYNWHEIPFDDDYPYYFPPKEGFKQAVAEMNAMEVWPMPYINGRLWDTDTPGFQTTGYMCSTKNEIGQPFTKTYDNGQVLATMCPTCQPWQDTINNIVWRLLDEYDVAGVYIDQIGAAAPRLCMDANHKHPLGGGDWWVRGYETMLSNIRSRIKKTYPDAFLTTEANAEPYMQFFDGYLVSTSMVPNLIPLFSAVYHDWALTFTGYGLPEDLDQDPDAFYSKSGLVFAFGAHVGWIKTTFLLDKKYQEGMEYLQRLAAMRGQALPWLALGEQLRPLHFNPELPLVSSNWGERWGNEIVSVDAVQHSVWRAPDGTVAVALTNVSTEAITASWDMVTTEYGLPDGAIAVTRLTPEGEESVTVMNNPVLHFSIPLLSHDACVLVLRPVTSINEDFDTLKISKLCQNYPNPFTTTTKISFDVSKTGQVEIKIFNHQGKEIKTLVNKTFTTGYHSIIWDGTDNSGKTISNGLYFYSMKSEDFLEVKKVLLLK